MRPSTPVFAALLGVALAAPSASAQFRAQVPRVGSPIELAGPATIVATRDVPSRRQYVITGAAVGAGVTALALLLYFTTSNGECLGCHPIMFTPVVIGGAAVGALSGLVVHGVVAPEPDRRLRLGLGVSFE